MKEHLNFNRDINIRQFNFSDNAVLDLESDIEVNAKIDFDATLNKSTSGKHTSYGYNIGYLSDNPIEHKPFIMNKTTGKNKVSLIDAYKNLKNNLYMVESEELDVTKKYLQYWFPLYEGDDIIPK